MGRFFESPQQRAIRELTGQAQNVITEQMAQLDRMQFDATKYQELLQKMYDEQRSMLLNKTAEYLASQGIPQGSIRAVNLASSLVPLSIGQIQEQLGILKQADLFNLQKFGMKNALAGTLANLYLAKAQGYSPYSPFDITLGVLGTLADIGGGIAKLKR